MRQYKPQSFVVLQNCEVEGKPLAHHEDLKREYFSDKTFVTVDNLFNPLGVELFKPREHEHHITLHNADLQRIFYVDGHGILQSQSIMSASPLNKEHGTTSNITIHDQIIGGTATYTPETGQFILGQINYTNLKAPAIKGIVGYQVGFLCHEAIEPGNRVLIYGEDVDTNIYLMENLQRVLPWPTEGFDRHFFSHYHDAIDHCSARAKKHVRKARAIDTWDFLDQYKNFEKVGIFEIEVDGNGPLEKIDGPSRENIFTIYIGRSGSNDCDIELPLEFSMEDEATQKMLISRIAKYLGKTV